MTNINNANNTQIILGILPIIISIVLLVIYTTNYKYLPYNIYSSVSENFQANSAPELDPMLNYDASIFRLLGDQNSYRVRIAEIENDIVEYNNSRADELRQQVERDRKRIDKLTEIKRQHELEKIKLRNEKEPKIINSIKGVNNNQILTVIPYDLDSYKVQINDKCMTVYDDNKYLLSKCDNSFKSSDSQKFKSERIYDVYNARAATNRDVTKVSEYPYNIFKSKVSNHCLALNNDGVSIVKCNPDDNRQQFNISEDKNGCPIV